MVNKAIKVTISLHPTKDADIIEYLGNTHRTFKIREAIRKAIHLDNVIDNALKQGLTNVPVAPPDKKGEMLPPVPSDLSLIETTDEIPVLPDDEIELKINQF